MTTFPAPVPIVAASLVLGLAAGLRAEPVDPFDPTPRQVQVEIEVSPHPADLGLVWSEPMLGTFSYVGLFPGHSQIAVPGPVYEDFLETHGLYYFTVIPGSFSEFTISIDRTDLHVTAFAGGQVDIGFGPIGTIGRSFGTAGTYGYFQLSPTSLYQACAFSWPPFFTCIPVSASAYDPQSGYLNAPGADTVTHPDIGPDVFPLFGIHGELRLSEVAPAVPALSVGWLGAAYGLVFAAVLRGSKKAGASARRRSQMRWRG